MRSDLEVGVIWAAEAARQRVAMVAEEQTCLSGELSQSPPPPLPPPSLHPCTPVVSRIHVPLSVLCLHCVVVVHHGALERGSSKHRSCGSQDCVLGSHSN